MSVAAHGGPARHVTFERERGVHRLRVTENLAHVVVTVGAENERAERLGRVFRALADERIPVFLIKLHHTAVSFAVESVHLPHVETMARDIALKSLVRQGLALITVEATSMRDLTGVMVLIADSIQAGGARLFGVGDSHNTVQCLIDGEHLQSALVQLAETFGLEEVARMPNNQPQEDLGDRAVVGQGESNG